MTDQFLPTTLGGWLSVVGVLTGFITTVVGLVIKFVRAPLVLQINGVGKRTKQLEEASTRHGAKIEELERHGDRDGFHSTMTDQRISKLESRQEALEKAYGEFSRRAEVGMARLEEKLDGLTGQMERILDKLGG